MATSVKVDRCDYAYDFICNKCSFDNEAILYCPKCDIYYCKACVQSLCKHHLLGQEETDRWGKRAPVPLDSDVECCNHKGYRLDLFCRYHDVVCCTLCSQLEHKDCKMEFTPVVAGEATLAESETGLQSYAKRLQQMAGDVMKERSGRQTVAKTRRAAAVESVQDSVGKMVAKLKTLETEAIRELDSKSGTCDGALQADIDVCGATVTELTQVQTTLAKKENDKIRGFIKSKKIKQSLKNTEKTLTDLNQNQKLENEYLSFHLNHDFEAVMLKLDNIGIFKTSPVQRSIQTTRPPVSSPRPYKAGNKTEVSAKVRGDKNTCDIYDMCQLPDGSIVVSDWANNKLKKPDGSYKVTCHCSLPASPWGVCHIDGDEVAVALVNSTIQFVSVGDSMTLTRSLSPGHNCTGVAHHQGRLYVTGGSGQTAALYVYSLSGSQLHVFSKDQNGQNMFSWPWFIALSPSGNTVYVADVGKGLVTMDTQGHVLATFSPSDLNGAEGVCVADDGSVFVGGFSSHNVIQVAEEGNNKLADVVTSSAGIEHPRGICIDKRRSKLIVGMRGKNSLAVFDLTK